MATTRPSRLTGLMALLLVTACGKGTDAALEAARAREAAAIAARGSDSALVKKYDVKDVTLTIPTDPAAIARAVRGFRGVEHVLELVATVEGVDYYNDSKATNVDAARRSLVAFDRPVVVILGGRF